MSFRLEIATLKFSNKLPTPIITMELHFEEYQNQPTFLIYHV